MKKALLLIDLQNDFCPGGALAVPEGNAVIAIANLLLPKFELVIASQDWHPLDHLSFAANHQGKAIGDVVSLDNYEQCLWPIHCVQGEWGAEFHPDLNINGIHKIFTKGMNKFIDSYSAFFDNEKKQSTGLDKYLFEKNITELYVMGLATDYCVKYTCLDAKALGFTVNLVTDGCRGVNLNSTDVHNALEEMRASGINLIESWNIFKRVH